MLKETLIKKMGQSSHLFVLAPVTLLAPRWYFRGLFAIVRRHNLQWGAKKACVTVSFDCDHREDIEALPKLLTLLERYPFKTSFACIGKWIEQYPDAHRGIVEYGHEVLNHTYSHPNNAELGNFQKFSELSLAEQEKEITQCHVVCQQYLNVTPVGFRIPHFGALYTPTVYAILKKLSYRYSSSLLAAKSPTAGAPFVQADGILEFPLSPCPAHPFGLLDTHHAFRKQRAWHRQPGAFFALFQELLQVGIHSQAHINLYFDPRDVVLYDDFVRIFDLLAEHLHDVHGLDYATMLDQFAFPRVND